MHTLAPKETLRVSCQICWDNSIILCPEASIRFQQRLKKANSMCFCRLLLCNTWLCKLEPSKKLCKQWKRNEPLCWLLRREGFSFWVMIQTLLVVSEQKLGVWSRITNMFLEVRFLSWFAWPRSSDLAWKNSFNANTAKSNVGFLLSAKI